MDLLEQVRLCVRARRRLRGVRLALPALALAATGAGVVLPAWTLGSVPAAFAQGTTTTSYTTPGTYTFTVPANVTSITFALAGAQGADGGGVAGSGGKGGSVQGTLAVTPGDTLTLIVGGKGVSTAGGSNGGGSTSGNFGGAGGGGGGASTVKKGATTLLVAGGGGGGGGNNECGGAVTTGGAGGGTTGGDGTGSCGQPAGRGGTASAGGARGGNGGNGTAGTGGSGFNGGGGGGGGWFGGGGGGGNETFGGGGGVPFGNHGSGAGGGGGSGFAAESATAVTFGTGTQTGDGSITLTYTAAVATATPTPTGTAGPAATSTATAVRGAATATATAVPSSGGSNDEPPPPPTATRTSTPQPTPIGTVRPGGPGASGGTQRGSEAFVRGSATSDTGEVVALVQDGKTIGEIPIGRMGADGSIGLLGVVREELTGATYAIVRRTDGKVVRVWISPDDPLRYRIGWSSVNAQRTYPIELVSSIPLDDQRPWPGQLARKFDGTDERIYVYDGQSKQWRLVPDLGTLQSLGLHWCDVSSADGGFFDRLPAAAVGAPYQRSGGPVSPNYPNCAHDQGQSSRGAGSAAPVAQALQAAGSLAGQAAPDAGPTYLAVRDLRSAASLPSANDAALAVGAWNGFAELVAGDEVLQWQPDGSGEGDGAFVPANVLDELGERGLDGWLQDTQGVPAAFDTVADSGLPFADVAAQHVALVLAGRALDGHLVAGLDGDGSHAVDALRSVYLATPDWQERYGLPMAAGRATVGGDDVVVVRGQRAVLSYHLTGPQAGEVTVATGAALGRQAGLWRPASLAGILPDVVLSHAALAAGPAR